MSDAPASQDLALDPYRDHYRQYLDHGWSAPLLLPAGKKSPPPSGFTGQHAPDPGTAELTAWGCSSGNIGLRLPDDVIGIDVDDYAEKEGGKELHRLERQLGKLPVTWTSTARGGGLQPSRIYFYRVPAGTRLAGGAAPGIDVIQHGHRYAVVWPSVHPDGMLYRWYRPGGEEASADFPMPNVAGLPALPEKWLAHLAAGASTSSHVAADENAGLRLLDNIRESDTAACGDMIGLLARATAEFDNIGEGGRHDTMLKHLMAVVMSGAAGHTGADNVLAILEAAWQDAAGAERTEEFERMLLGAARKAVTERAEVAPEGTDPWDPAPVDPCRGQLALEDLYNAPATALPDGVVPEAVLAPPAHFEPRERDDQGLAVAVREHVYPAARYAVDADRWIVREPERWGVSKMRGRTAVSMAANHLPHGDKDAEKGTPERDAHDLRQRFRKSATASAIGAALDAVVHIPGPLDVKLGELDADADLLWAGGVAWDLRASADRPTRADVDPGTPHLHAARFTPEVRPTPLWDAFTAAVWPDPEVRNWAMHVLAVAVTGWSPRVLPLLFGESGRGKTQVVELLAHVIGTYGGEGDSRLITTPDAHASIVFALKGKRLVYIDEPPSGHHDRVERLKMLTGGARLTGNAMRQDPVSFDPTHTLVMMANPDNTPPLTDDALRSRLKIIDCAGDPERVSRTRAAIGRVNSVTWAPQWGQEAPGVLAAMMRYAARWLADPSVAENSAAPAAAQMAVADMVAMTDPVQRWMEERTTPAEPGTLSSDLHRDFAHWHAEHPEYRRRAVPGQIPFGIRLTKLGVGKTLLRQGAHRALTLNRPEWAMPAPPAPASGAATIHNTQLSTNHSQPENPRSEAVSADSVVSVDSSSENQTTNTYTYIEENIEGIEGSTVQTHHTIREPEAESTPDQAKPGVVSSPGIVTTQPTTAEDPDMPRCPVCETPQLLTKARRFRSHKDVTGFKCEGTGKAVPGAEAEKAAAKEAARQGKIAEAGGPLCELPAWVNREGLYRQGHLNEVGTLLAGCIQRSGFLALDVETTGFPVGHPAYGLRTVQLGDDLMAVVLDRDDPEHMRIAALALAATPEIVPFNATADTVPAALEGLGDFDALMAKVTDVAIMGKLADPASTDNEEGLKALAPAVLGDYAVIPAADKARSALFKAGGWLTEVKPTHPVSRSGWAQVDKRCQTMVVYAASDVLDAAALRKRLPMPAPALMARERKLAAITGRVSITGIKLDGALVEEQLDEREPRVEGLTRKLHELTAADGAAIIANPESSPQVIQAFTSRGVELPKGKATITNPNPGPTANKAALTPLTTWPGLVGELATTVLDYRKDSTLLKNMVRPWSVQTRQGDGRTYPTIYTLGADTGRMSCVRPNLQQVSREGGLRECLLADDGFMIVAADFSSVEVRVLAALSGDVQLKAMIAASETCALCLAGAACIEHDLHAKIAEVAYGPEWTKLNRYNVKRSVFGRLYGGGIDTLAAQTGLSLEMTQRIIDILDALTPGAAQWARRVRNAVQNGHTTFESYSGRVIHLDPELPHKAVNYLVQGTGRELLVDAILRWDAGPYGGGVILPVHDEILAFVAEDIAEEAAAYLTECMTTEINGVKIAVEADSPVRRWTSVG